MRVKIAKWGNSLAVRLPKAAVESAGLELGAELELSVEGRDLRLRRLPETTFYRLEDLLAEMDRLGPENEPETVDWGPDVGAEIIDDAYSRGAITLDDILRRGHDYKSATKSAPATGKRNNAPRRRRHRVG